jgi:tetratricopeptide (TPR) repeat protein
MRFPIGAMIAATLLLGTGQAYAQSQCTDDDFKWLDHTDQCTRAIESKKYSGPDLARLYTNRGLGWQLKRDFDRALADFNEAIRLDPKNAVAFRNRGLAVQNKGDLDRAVADFSEAIKLDPKHAGTYHFRGAILLAKGDLDRAIADFSEVIRLTPANDKEVAPAYLTRSWAFVQKKDYERAIADWREAVRLIPDNVVARRQICTVAFIPDSDPSKILSACNEAVRHIADQIRDYSAKARSGPEADRRVKEGAVNFLLNPNYASALAERGIIHLRLGRRDEALADFDAALKINPKFAASLYGRGLAKLRKGDAPGAKTDLAAAKAIQANIAEFFTRLGLTEN